MSASLNKTFPSFLICAIITSTDDVPSIGHDVGNICITLRLLMFFFIFRCPEMYIGSRCEEISPDIFGECKIILKFLA